MDSDIKYIKIALFLLKKIIGTTYPNPPVVSLIVESNKSFNKNKIIGFGMTSVGGRPHAEANALKGLKFEKEKNYTLYSTLEPCCHKGRDESCVSKILKSKIKRVVYSLKDPDERVNGLGHKTLSNSGIDVLSGVLIDQTKEIYKGYIYNRKFNRPKITLKIGCSLDSKISNKANSKFNITNKFSRYIVHLFRSEADAILIGGNTVRIDNPKLNVRLMGLENFSPLRIILSKTLKFNFSSEVFKNCKKFPTIVFTVKTEKKKIQALLKKEVRIIKLEEKNYNLKNILEELSKLGIQNLMVEGGSEIFTSFIKENFVDEIIIFRSNYFIGSQGKDIFNNESRNFKNSFLFKNTTSVLDNNLEILTKYKEY